MAIEEFEATEGVSRTNVNRRITQANAYFPVSVANGGTGATSLTSGGILVGNGANAITSVATLPISKGGTGATTLSDVKTNLEITTKTVLYNNSSGSSSTITISESVSNFDCVDIQYKTGDNPTNTVRLYDPNNMIADLPLIVAGSSGVYFKTSMVLFSGTTISFDSSINTWIEGSSCGVEGATPQIKITKVIGYK